MTPKRWCVRPGDEVTNPQTGRAYPPNHALPRVSYHAEHAHTATEQRVFEELEKRGKKVEGGAGRKIRQVSVAQLARETEMPQSTVRDCLRSLVKKCSIVPWDVKAAKAEPRKRGDHGGVTTWMIPSRNEILVVRRAHPTIGKVAGLSGIENCYVIGKGKRLLTPEEIAFWKIDAVVAEAAKLAAAALGATETELSAPKSSDAPAPLAEPSEPPGTGPPVGTDPLPKVVKQAFHDCVTRKNFSDHTARGHVKRARALAAKLEEPLSDQEIADAIYAGWLNAGKRVSIIGFYDKTLPEKLTALFESRARQTAENTALADKCPRCKGDGRHPSFPQETCPECGGSGVPQLTRAAG